MSYPMPTRSPAPTLVRVATGAANVTAGVLAGCLMVTSAVGGQPQVAEFLTPVAEPFDPEVVLPSRVDAVLHRTYAAVDRSAVAVDDKRRTDAKRALRAAAVGFQRSHNAVLRQVQAVPDPESEEESTAGPDSALAGLNVTQTSIGMLAGLFDRLGARGVVKRIRVALTVAQKRRVVLLNTITGLDPEGAGADYADSLADTVPMYTDEVAGIQEALDHDKLTPLARAALNAALKRSQNAESLMLASFGGGE